MKYKILELKTVEENDGKLTFFESMREIPFDIKRVFSIYAVPSEEIVRANHASINTDFFLQVVAGKVSIKVDDGKRKNDFCLNTLNSGLYIPKMTWMTTHDFSKNAILHVYASTTYDECRYINDYDEYIAYKKGLY